MHRVVVLALEGVYPFELSIPTRIFASARSAAGEPLYEVLTCSIDGGPVRTSADFSITVDHGAELVGTADTLIIPPFGRSGPADETDWYPPPLAVVFSRLRPETRIVSICTASYALAAAGLLDGRPATTHWQEADHLQRLHPEIKVDPDVLFVDDGDVLTSAGVAAGIDLCMHIIRRDHGSEVANGVARRCVIPPWREGGQAQFIERPIPGPSAATTSATRDWALRHLHRPIPLTELAAHARMSVRTFSRRFRDEVGMPPGQWLTQQRVELARRLLETTDLPVDRIAAESGFGTAASLRQHLVATIGVPPSAYRHTFRTAEPRRTGAGPRAFGTRPAEARETV
ncbi:MULTISPECIES: GlxA family transcriptional regulator [Actinomadura]|uniref:Helix-turn-helix domain-containing protein n=1 Tax=Actinomadura litoris TaxID=2678616 RepID=A0A7K1L1B3_9ACTN|nr:MULTISPECIES: helix-turn-helix domain-containing protein [Actinomadura]MBT2206864.1 helix-turn-helix domain-containing protein [Actinomadura sp. NEAU-AAG7]MUN38036.1 helix-turn-helix domain-containing protein [Actinomadura litoris]